MKTQTNQTLAEIGVQSPDQLARLYDGLREEFDGASVSVSDEASWKVFRDEWLGRKSGVITSITENWLKKAPNAELKRACGQALNELRAHAEATLEEKHAAIGAGADQAALARECVDLSLPGVMRPV